MRHSFNILLYKYLEFIIKSKKYCSHFMRKCKERHIRCTFCFENFIHEHLYHSDHYLLPSSSPISPLPTKFMTFFKIFIVTCIYTHMCTHVYAHMHIQLLSLSSSISAAYNSCVWAESLVLATLCRYSALKENDSPPPFFSRHRSPVLFI